MATLPAADGVITDDALAASTEVVSRVFQVLGGILGLQLAHDVGHALAAAAHKMKISTPYFLPSLQVYAVCMYRR
jgi:hypothetical protein